MRTFPCEETIGVMATDSDTNAIADFDIDEVIDWDKHDIPSKDIEFDHLQSLNVAASNVVSTPTTQSSASNSRNSGGNEGLVLDRSLHHSRDPGTAIVSLPQVPQASAINPVFPGDPSSLLNDIRQEYLHAQSLGGRSRTPPTPTFPSENFDLPPITPLGSMHGHSTFPVGQQPLRMALLANLNRPTTVQPPMPSFVQTNLPPSLNSVSMNTQLQSIGGDSNIEQLIDEIVERDMPQGVSEPIVFTPQVPQEPNPSTAHLQMASNALQKGISTGPVRSSSPGQLSVAPTVPGVKNTLPLGVVTGGSPLNSASSPGSPLASSRSPSPNIKQTNHAGKLSASVRSTNQSVRHPSPSMQPGSPLQNMGGLSPSQSSVKATRTYTSHSPQILTSSQMLQMAVPSVVASSSSKGGSSLSQFGVNSAKLTTNSVPVKSNVEGTSVNSQSSRITMSAPAVQSPNLQLQGENIATHNMGVSGTNPNNLSAQKILQGTIINPIGTQAGVKHNQTNPLQAFTSNPALLSQLVKAIGQPKQQGATSQTVASTGNIQTGQPLICYVVPQNPTSGAQSSQVTKSSLPVTASNQPVKMILVNANSTLKSPVSVKQQPMKMTLMNAANPGLNSKTVLPFSQQGGANVQLEAISNPSITKISSFAKSDPLSVSGVNGETIMVQNNAEPFMQLGTTGQKISPGLFGNNPLGKQSSNTVGSTQPSSIPLQQTPLPGSGNVVQITFVNEATAISQVVAATPTSTLSSTSGASQALSPVNIKPSVSGFAEDQMSSPQVALGSSTEPIISGNLQDSDDDDDDDSTPLSQVAESLKKVTGANDVKRKKKKKKDKGTKRKKRDKDSLELNKPLTAYELFFKETQATIRSKNPAAQFGDIRKIVDQMWENLTENNKKALQEKAQQEYKKSQEEHKAKTFFQEEEPSVKLRKSDRTDSIQSPSVDVPVTLEPNKDTPAVTVSKPLSRTLSQTPMAGKPVATVPPMAASKAPTGTTTQSTVNNPVSTKTKKSKVTVKPITQRMCLCNGCNKPASTTKERGTQYCSNECIVKHCRMVFTLWVEQRNMKSDTS